MREMRIYRFLGRQSLSEFCITGPPLRCYVWRPKIRNFVSPTFSQEKRILFLRSTQIVVSTAMLTSFTEIFITSLTRYLPPMSYFEVPYSDLCRNSYCTPIWAFLGIQLYCRDPVGISTPPDGSVEPRAGSTEPRFDVVRRRFDGL